MQHFSVNPQNYSKKLSIGHLDHFGSSSVKLSLLAQFCSSYVILIIFQLFFFFWGQFNRQFKNIECDSTNSAKVTLSKELKIEKTRGKFNIYEETVKERERERGREKLTTRNWRTIHLYPL